MLFILAGGAPLRRDGVRPTGTIATGHAAIYPEVVLEVGQSAKTADRVPFA